MNISQQLVMNAGRGERADEDWRDRRGYRGWERWKWKSSSGDHMTYCPFNEYIQQELW